MIQSHKSLKGVLIWYDSTILNMQNFSVSPFFSWHPQNRLISITNIQGKSLHFISKADVKRNICAEIKATKSALPVAFA